MLAGAFKLTAGKGQFAAFIDPRTGRYRQVTRSVEDFPGTVVMLEMSTDVEFDFDQALNLISAVPEPILDVVDLEHVRREGNSWYASHKRASATARARLAAHLGRSASNLPQRGA